jgi:hypothetical protein
MLLAYLLLGTALTISAVAIYYSVAGLAAIFAAAFWPIVIMGTTLEVAKLVAASWLKMYWEKIPRLLKWYLTVAVVMLMLITSMGIFGFLSKAHLDQAIPTGDVADRVALIDEKIRTERENIDASRRALKQMDEAVDQTMSRSDSEKGAERAVQIRRNQQTERARLQKDIATAQSNISRLNEERAPIAKDLRKVEAEVGPIKYIAKLVYGDNPDANILEKAVTWVIMMIIFVFDPLAVLMLLASQWTFAHLKEQKLKSQEQIIPQEKQEDNPEIKTETQEESWPVGSRFWPFPVVNQEVSDAKVDDDFKFLAEDKDLYPAEQDWQEQEQQNEESLDSQDIESKLNKEIINQADPFESNITYDWDGGDKLYSKTYIQHLIKQLQEKKISIDNLNKEELDEVTAELEAQQKFQPNKDNNTA